MSLPLVQELIQLLKGHRLQSNGLSIVNSARAEVATISTGTGTPEGAVTAPVGSLFLRLDGGASTTLYVKTSGAGNTGWTAK